MTRMIRPGKKTKMATLPTSKMTSKRQPKSQYTLSKIRQRPGELLQSYLDRFNHAALQVQGLKEEVHVHLLADGLDSTTRLAESFFKAPAKSINVFMTRSKKYLEVEQMRQANAPRRDPDRNTPPKDKSQSEVHKQDCRGKGPDSKSASAKAESKGKYNNYTPLNTRFCSFHGSLGHTTDQCYELRDAIEKFVREGKLRQYVIKTQGRKREKRKQCDRPGSPASERNKDDKRQKPGFEDNEFREAEFECNVISGAFGGGGAHESTKKVVESKEFS
ncbi:hypothetical protein K1719_041727 [Acacia pycnantha]|nr:hypothetical protein K1719_041727 [Acacia pycnantha]